MSEIARDDGRMTEAGSEQLHATIHLVAQTTITFDADALWPLRGGFSRVDSDLDSFAAEVTRRLRADGYVGFCPDSDSIAVIPLSAVKRIDFGLRK